VVTKFLEGGTTTMQHPGLEPGRGGTAVGGLNHRATGASARTAICTTLFFVVILVENQH
jgi:hypothetical protein